MTKSICFLITLLLIGVMFMVGCEPATQEICNDKDELMATIDKFYEAIENNDVDTRISIFTDSAIMMPSHWAPYQGKETIAQVIMSAKDSIFKIKDREIVDFDLCGGLAYTVNSYFYTWHNVGDEPQWHKTKNVHIWKKTADGSWKLHVDIWNSDVPMSQFANE